MRRRKLRFIFLTITLLLFLSCLSSIYAENTTANTIKDNSKYDSVSNNSPGVVKSANDNNIKNITHKVSKMNVSLNKINDTNYPQNTTVTGKIITEDKKLPDINNIHLYVNNKKQSNMNLLLENNGTFTYITKQKKGNHTFKIYINDTKYEKKTVTANFTVTEKLPQLDKTRPIYFAMDHTNSKDKQICNNIVQKLKQEGFKVVRYKIGPNAMYQNMLYLYKHKIHNAIMFHLFNGVDPSNIREVALYGPENRGRIVRQRGNDVVLAWFYDASDPIHVGGNCYKSVRASETGPRLYNPKSYMDKNKILYICTSSDHFKHKSTADYNGDKTTLEFMKFFTTEENPKYKTTTRAKVSLTDDYLITITGTVKYPTSKINGYVTIKDQNNKIIKKNVAVKNNKFTTQFMLYQVGKQKLTVTYRETPLYSSSNTTVTATINVKNATITARQEGNIIENNSIKVMLTEPNTKEILADQPVKITYNGKTVTYYTDKNGHILANLNVKKNQTVTIRAYHDNKLLNTSKVKVKVYMEDVKVKVEKVTGVIGANITLKATVTGKNGNPVNGGKIVFMLNGKTLKTDNNINSKKNALKLNVINGSATYVLPVKVYMRNITNISASYAGTVRYKNAISKNAKVCIAKRMASVNLTITPTSASQGEKVSFVARVSDVTVNSTCNSFVNQNVYITFKLNDVPLTYSNGKLVKVKVKDNVAIYNFSVPRGIMCLNKDNTRKKYVVKAELVGDNYYSVTRKASFSVKRTNINITISKVQAINGSLSVKASIKDVKGRNVVGRSVISLKVNGELLKDSMNSTLKFNVTDGKVDLCNIGLGSDVGVRSVMIFCSASQSYLCGSRWTNVIKNL